MSDKLTLKQVKNLQKGQLVEFVVYRSHPDAGDLSMYITCRFHSIDNEYLYFTFLAISDKLKDDNDGDTLMPGTLIKVNLKWLEKNEDLTDDYGREIRMYNFFETNNIFYASDDKKMTYERAYIMCVLDEKFREEEGVEHPSRWYRTKHWVIGDKKK